MNKKVVVFGGGTGMSYLLRGLKQYPLDITAVVSVCDDGGSTGILRDEFNILAVGDIRKVIVSLSKTEGEFERILNYRFMSNGSLNNHTVGNILLTAASDVTGSVQEGIEVVSKILNLKGKVVPFTEDTLTLNGRMEDGSIVKGEHNITKSKLKIEDVFYDTEPRIKQHLIDNIIEADLIVFSMGSLYTSVIPTLLSSKIKDAIDTSNAKLIYACNLFTQPGETDKYNVSDHIKILNKYLNKRKVEYVIANNKVIDEEIALKYQTQEQKDPVLIDRENIDKLNIKLIEDDLALLGAESFKHDVIKLGYLIFSIIFEN